LKAIGPFKINQVHRGDALELLRRLPDECVQCCVTSPPYWGLRDYGVAGQMGIEKTLAEYVSKMVAVFEEVRRVLRKDGTLWLNIGDSYAHNTKGSVGGSEKQRRNKGAHYENNIHFNHGLKPKDLCGIPWRLAFALQASGWYLRCDIIWSKPNPMPESVTDRPTKSHEYIFLLSKSAKYYYDAEAIKEPAIYREDERPFGNAGGNRHGDEGKTYHPLYKDARSYDGKHSDKQRGHGRRHAGFNDRWDQMSRKEQCSAMRNKRSVWEIATMTYKEAHFATFPPKLVEPCILAGSKPGDLVFDPFAGSGTTGEVAIRLGRKFIGFDLNEKYCREFAAPRLAAAERGQTIEQYKAGQMCISDYQEAKP